MITVYADRSFSFDDQDPAGVLPPQEGGADPVGLEGARQGQRRARIRRSQLREIAEAKMKDLNANDIDAAAKIIEGSARAMGLEVRGGLRRWPS